MKLLREYFIVMSIIFCSYANANGLTPTLELKFKERISAGCVANYKTTKPNKARICKCVADNFIHVGRNWTEPKDKVAVLEYVAKDFERRLSKQEIDNDPFVLDDFIFDIPNDCSMNPNFKLRN